MSFLEEIEWLAIEHHLLGRKNPGFCDHCGRDVEMMVRTPSQTMYHWDGTGEDPNQDFLCCLDCSREYTEQMNSQWAEYHSMTR